VPTFEKKKEDNSLAINNLEYQLVIQNIPIPSHAVPKTLDEEGGQENTIFVENIFPLFGITLHTAFLDPIIVIKALK
jgi:hypothetical protein